MIINDSTQLLTNLRNDLSVWCINLYHGIYVVYDIYDNNTNSFNAFFFPFFCGIFIDSTEDS